MSRKKVSKKKNLTTDYKYKNLLISKLINYAMINGKKNKSEIIVYKALKKVSLIHKKNPIEVFATVIENIKPLVESKVKRVGGSIHQVPMEIRPERSLTLALKWIIHYSRLRKSEKNIILKISSELNDAYNKRGGAWKKKETIHRIAESNKAFSHYRW